MKRIPKKLLNTDKLRVETMSKTWEKTCSTKGKTSYSCPDVSPRTKEGAEEEATKEFEGPSAGGEDPIRIG